MINGLTIQLKVSSYEEGFNWYKMLLNREPDFVPHEHFAEWELVKGAWLQIAKGEPDKQGDRFDWECMISMKNEDG